MISLSSNTNLERLGVMEPLSPNNPYRFLIFGYFSLVAGILFVFDSLNLQGVAILPDGSNEVKGGSHLSKGSPFLVEVGPQGGLYK